MYTAPSLELARAHVHRARSVLRVDVQQQPVAVARAGQVGDVARLGQRVGDVARGFNSTDLDDTVARRLQRLADDRRRLTLALGPDDGRLPLLLGALDDEFGPLGLLLRDLLRLDGLRELCESQIESDVGDDAPLPKVRLTIDTSSSSMLNSRARFSRSSRIRDETTSRCVMSSAAGRVSAGQARRLQ